MSDEIPAYSHKKRAGDTYTFTSRYRDKVTSQLQDFTGYTIRAQMRERSTSDDIAATLVCTSPELGVIRCELDGETTAALVPPNRPSKDYVYDIEITDSSGFIKTVFDVTVRFVQGSTR